MYRAARPERRKAVGGMFLSLALTSFLTGVTEPVEFTFMFLAPALYAIHAVLTGIAMVVMNLLQVKLGFGFSAGLFDYVLNYGKSTHPLLLLPVGLAYSAIYYFVFRFVIARFNLMTPGRDEQADAVPSASQTASERAIGFIVALGGANNLATVDACTTRLRLIVNDQTLINEVALKSLGAKGIVRPAPRAVQVVLGPIADQVAGEIRAAMPSAPKIIATDTVPTTTRSQSAPSVAHSIDVQSLVHALGGASNIASLHARSTRVCVALKNGSLIDTQSVIRSGARALAQLDEHKTHLIVGPAAESLAQDLQRVIRAS
jgi:PTS system N-acetylglucosamine-specific IIC component